MDAGRGKEGGLAHQVCPVIDGMPQGRRTIRKLLVANRGEIALRVLRACRELDIRTVAVHSSVDHDAPFVGAADEAVLIGDGPSASASYLLIDHLIKAAKRTGADAIHPGYGFLSENEAFAQRCEEEGIIFVGPTPQAIAAMGSKREAKLLLRKKDQSIPLIPGYDDADQSTETLAREARNIGFPLLLKASAGGGGKGMRVVRDETQLLDAIDSAKREARNSFGDDTLLIERYFDDVRHIEFQILGDEYGNIIHLNERECSVQRRHQKVIEEAPSPIMTPALRERMGLSAVAIGSAITYRGAGTVEFIVDDKGDYFFLEVNTRLQVEHPVTEMTTGIDLVHAQIYIAQGASLAELGLRNATPVKGHAIECRLCAEDPENNFFPCTGRILTWDPSNIANVRYDSGVRSGSDITVYYDPLICKIIAFAPTRQEALAKLVRALSETVILGVTTNKVFLQQILLHPAFRSGKFNTHFIDQHLPSNARKRVLDEIGRNELIIAALLWEWRRRERSRTLLRHLPSGWHNSPYCNSKQEFQVGGDFGKSIVLVEYHYMPKRGAGAQRNPNAHFYLKIATNEYADVILHHSARSHEVDVSISGLRRRFIVNAAENRLFVHSIAHGELSLILKSRYAQAFIGDAAGEGEYIAQMPGKILQLLVADGAEVAEGDSILIMESMKMESKITAHKAGKVKLFVREEQVIQEGTRLLNIE